jgi:hypothetical protein
MRVRVSSTAAGILLTVGSCLSADEPAWTPPKPTNLQVLDKSLSGKEVVGIMKGFTRSLGVRCQFCHVHTGNDPEDLSTFDFASDKNKHKGIARTMLRMISAINDEHLKDVTSHAPSGKASVTCYTCHRGEKEPPTSPSESQ